VFYSEQQSVPQQTARRPQFKTRQLTELVSQREILDGEPIPR